MSADYEIAQIHAEAGQRQAALRLAIDSFEKNQTPPSGKVIKERAVEFYAFLAVAAPRS